MIFRIKQTEKNGKAYYTAQRRVFIFFWTDYFPCKKGEGKSKACSSNYVPLVLDFLGEFMEGDK